MRLALFPSASEARVPKSLHGLEMTAAHDPAALWLKQVKASDPERFREVAQRYPVLSTYQVDRRKAGEVELREAEESEAGEYRPGTLDRQIHREWLAASWQEAA